MDAAAAKELGKLLGAGGGGFILFFVEPERQPDVRAALNSLLEVGFHFETTGSQILYYSDTGPNS